MFRKLLVPLDGSPLAENALGVASRLAQRARAQIELVLVHQPVPYAGFADAPWSSAQEQSEEKYLTAVSAKMEKEGADQITHELIRGDVVGSICDRAKATGADLIVLTSHGRTGFSRFWFGSVASGVLRHSSAPVLILPLSEKETVSRKSEGFNKLLVTLDGSTLGVTILPVAADFARSTDAKLTLLTVVRPVPMLIPESVGTFASSAEIPDDSATRFVVDEASRHLTEHATDLKKQGFHVETKVIVAAHVARAIIDFSAEMRADAIAMSSHGRGVSRLITGSVADKVVRGSSLPVLVQRPAAVEKMNDFISTTNELELPSLTVY